MAAAWILSAVFSTPMLVLYKEGLVQGQVQCWIDLPSPWQWQLYLTLVAVSLLVLPALLIFACYIVIVRTIWVQSAALTMATSPTHRAHRSATGGGGAAVAMLDEDQESRRASSRGIIPRAKIKTVKMTFVIVFGKCCCCLLDAVLSTLETVETIKFLCFNYCIELCKFAQSID